MTVTIKTAEDIAGMRVAGKLAADVLEMIAEHVKPGVTTDQLTDLPRLHRQRAAGHPGPAQLQGLPEVDLHLDQPRGLPRHPQRQAAEGR
jgi:methionyl aminopeptidase